MPGSTTDLRRQVITLVASVALLAVVVGASVSVGARAIAPAEVWRAFVDYAGTDDHITVRDVRVPRTVLAVCVGVALAGAGALIQTLTRNPLAEPGILGVTAGAGFAINVGVLLGLAGSQSAQLALAVVGSAVAAMVVYAVGQTSPLRLVLAGVALTSVLLGVSLGLRLLYPDVFDRHRFWSVGALAGVEQTPLPLPVAVIGAALVGAIAVSGPLTALSLGEEVARTLGAQVVRTRLAVPVLVTVLAGAATAVAGPIAFVGLIVPHRATSSGCSCGRWGGDDRTPGRP